MAEIIPIHQKRTFSLEEARAVLPIVRRITERSSDSYRMVRTRMDSVRRDPAGCVRFEERLHDIVVDWVESMRRLGCEARGLWIVDFDRGDGFYCWKYPEEDIMFFHDYDGGFSARIPLESLHSAQEEDSL